MGRGQQRKQDEYYIQHTEDNIRRQGDQQACLQQEVMHAFTAILFFCFTDMILMKEIQSSKVFHLIECSTEIKREMIDVSLKEVVTNSTLLKYSPKNNRCTSYTSNAACFVEGKGMFSTLKYYTDNIRGNTSYVCVRQMINMNGEKTFTTFTATITVDAITSTSEAKKTTATTPMRTAITSTSEAKKTTATTPMRTAITSTSEAKKTTATTPMRTAITSTSEANNTTATTPMRIAITSTSESKKTTATTPMRTAITSTSEAKKTTATTPMRTATTSTSEDKNTTATSPVMAVSMATKPINDFVNPNTEDETTFTTVLITTVVTICAVIFVFIFVACVVFYRKLKRQRALNINTPAIGGVQSDTEDISNGQGAQISTGHFAQTTIGANSGTDLALNMELSQINHDGEPFPCHSEVSFQPTAVDGFRPSGTAVVLHPDPHVPDCQNPAPSRGSYVQRSLESEF